MKRSLNVHQLNLHLGASPKIHSSARALRKRSTDAEQILWEELRNKKIENCKFRRQHPIIQFIADFYCHEAKLIIEVDGSVHQVESVAERDNGRMFELEEQGFRIMRFTNEEIYYEMNRVIDKIRKAIQDEINK